MSPTAALSNRTTILAADAAATTPAVKTSDANDDPLANKATFLRLLVAQLQHQNPLDPSDPMQYITQLTQFSELEQQLGSRAELEAIHSTLNEFIDQQKTVAGKP
jgi:flagellar basal-body rod modification protein FlgD